MGAGRSGAMCLGGSQFAFLNLYGEGRGNRRDEILGVTEDGALGLCGRSSRGVLIVDQVCKGTYTHLLEISGPVSLHVHL